MRQIIPELLWIGNAHDILDVRGVLSLGVRAVVDLAASEAPVQYPRDVAYCRLPLNDGSENEPAILRLAVYSTVEFIKNRIPTLVACSAGMSRSPVIVAAALAIVEGIRTELADLFVPPAFGRGSHRTSGRFESK